MKLKDVLHGLTVLGGTADMEMDISGVSYDSRTTQPGDLFVAISGAAADGHKFISGAKEKGAVCAVCQHEIDESIPYVVVESTRRALAVIGDNWFDHPAKEMTMIGITGTNGKTTSTYLIKSILEQKAGAKVGLVGTIQNMIGNEVIHTERTTPESFELHKLFRRMSDAGCSHVVMEVSSHALALDRVYGIRFAEGIFTNLTQDHLDFHGTMENYCAAKALLFENSDIAIYNSDDDWSWKMLENCRSRRFSYSVTGEADLMAKDVSLSASGVSYKVEGDTEWAEVFVGIPGPFTVYNTLDAIAACWNLGVSMEDCAAALRRNHGVKGRMEVIPTPGKNYTVLNDYAHTPDALENVLQGVKGFAKGRTVVLFGCGGDRDRTKRPQMGAIAARLADFAIVTSDNPRTEEPQAIIDDIVAGMAGSENYTVVPDRVEAIHYAMDHAQPGDVIVLAGKGHEDYQVIGTEKFHMDEREIVRDWLHH
ncbi:MAG: UDP-N-acetylmuramoyl-L-alanyl-D-glutamate--2,6-diaminopimelate ligase [Clostridiales bacterium]|nr:UDP-N-acetylmuramoyl-L-alanyl-D-glutamate--2,6-diaminopimelate ligase [Candidatus Cacconaster stercorequi]